MSVPMSLLAMLDERPMYGLEMKLEFDSRTGGIWPLNVGQVYTTVGRLERDELVRPLGESEEGQKLYEITEVGREALAAWFDRPSSTLTPARDELVLKLILAISKQGIDVPAVIQAERRAALEELQEYTRLKADVPAGDDLGWLILIDSLIFKAEGRVRWLDACEARITRHRQPQTLLRSDRPASPLLAERSHDREVLR